MANCPSDEVWTLIELQTWSTFIEKAAAGEFDGEGPNASTIESLLLAKVVAIQTTAELKELAEGMAAVVRTVYSKEGLAENTSRMRTVAAVALHSFPRFRESLGLITQIGSLAELLQGVLNCPILATDYMPFSAEGKKRLYARIILRELGLPFTVNELKDDSLLFSSDPAILLDGLQSDRNFDLFASVAMFYFYQGWLDPTDALLRFDSWLEFIQSLGKPDVHKRVTSISTDNIDTSIDRRAVLRYLRCFSNLAKSSTSRLNSGEFVYNGSELSELLDDLIVRHFGTDLQHNALVEISPTTRALEAKTAVLQINCANMAQEFLTHLFPDRTARSDLVDIVCETAGTSRPPNHTVTMRGVTPSQAMNHLKAK